MNYYIQGDPVRADKIKAAFERLGINVLDFGFADKTVVYCSIGGCGGCVQYIPYSINLMHILYSHPDYKELELDLPAQPNFKVGDWITDGNITIQIEDVRNNCYTYSSGVLYSTRTADKVYHLWTIQDAKDGDVLATDNGWSCIFKAFDGWTFSSYCFMDSEKWFYEVGSEVHTPDSRMNGKIHPATKEQRDLLFKKMKEAGYTWDEKNKELKKTPVKPKFKAGDWLWHKEKGVFPVLIVGYDEERGYLAKYIGSESYFGRDATENEYRLWTIADARDGDVLVCYSEAKGNPIEQAGIFKQYVGQHGGCSNTFLTHTGIDWDGNIIINGYMGSTNILPATKEQRDRLFQNIKEAGYEWDADKKELIKIQPHYDIANFQPRQWVLVRQGDGCAWRLDIFSNLKEGAVSQFECVGNSMVQCIPFDGNENLLGTTDPCDEFYINW